MAKLIQGKQPKTTKASSSTNLSTKLKFASLK
jgi:hypothetical protein